MFDIDAMRAVAPFQALSETTPMELPRPTADAWTLDGKELTLDFPVKDNYHHMAGHIDHYRKRLDEAAASQHP
ncbi:MULTISPECIES: hypothetical protein [unclassified Pseudodesulfovibrio]|uniref:hypothetical protein n=1 Tax=unclassified Pseudodesulfovibrio TaxID=2661612 RepID=UPI000FEC1B77|nr:MULTISPECIES: hypothetical protein [unclassified Pseudodesulfovibrio]MCJ2165665.1 hypothetical protein [Pseudodesulfovibrio sp. S3-i]RWU02931.1 hypothetical protein DWB63_13580 [Pseudodesulfovibrio sp. S3]